MTYSLSTSEQKYALSWSETALCAGTLSSLPYAARHWQLASVENASAAYRLGHRTIALLEAIPAIGLLVGLAERIMNYVSALFSSNTTVEALQHKVDKLERKVKKLQTINSALEINGENSRFDTVRMVKNSLKAVLDHPKKPHNPYISLRRAISLISTNDPYMVGQLSAKAETIEADGMNTRCLFLEQQQGAIAAIFEPCENNEPAKIAKQYFHDHFFEFLAKNNNNPLECFEDIISQLNEKLCDTQFLASAGTSVLAAYIDHATKKVYTATLGSSEAHIYRRPESKTESRMKSKMKSIPLSPVRNWGHPKEALRAVHTLQNPEIENTVIYRGIQQSRLIGGITMGDNNPIKPKAKVTVSQIFANDILFLRSSPLLAKNERELVDFIRKNKSAEGFVHELVSFAGTGANDPGDQAAIVVRFS